MNASARHPVNAVVDKLNLGLLIDGEWEPAASGRTFAVENPATGRVIAEVADGQAEDARRAIESTSRAQGAWGRTAPRARSEILRRTYELLVSRIDQLAALITAEMGKPLADARGEVLYAAEFFRWFSEEAVRIGGDHTFTGDGRNRVLVSRGPVGPCVLVTPWNFPLAMGARKIGPAVAAGCTMVFKPAEQTPLTSLALAEILLEAGLPAGVLNVVTTSTPDRVVTVWMQSGIARKVSFTGSTEIGKLLLAQASENVMRSSMELGGNAPFIVCADADLDRAVEAAVVAKMRNMGQACTAANRMFVHSSVADEFCARLGKRLAGMVVGDGAEPGTEVGPLIDQAGLSKTAGLVNDAVERGATVVVGGARRPGPGHFFLPTVLADVPRDAQLMSTEIFGPVAPIVPFDDEEEAIRLANDTPWGLVGYLFTSDVDRAMRLSEDLEVGMVGLNTGLVSNVAAPFGGVKQSGLGREGGRIGIEEYLEYKYLAIPRDAPH